MNLKATLDEQELDQIRAIVKYTVDEELSDAKKSILYEAERVLYKYAYSNNYPGVYQYTYQYNNTKDSLASSPYAVTEKPLDLGKYAGKLVFVEQQGTDDKGNPVSGYYNGEYFVIRDTPGTIYGVKLAAGYGGHETKQFALIGKNPYKVLDSYAPTADQITNYIKDMSVFLEQGKTKKQWVDSVYTSAESNLRAVKRATGRE